MTKDTSILTNVGANIRLLRKQKKLTIDELADMADLSGKYLQGVEVGIRNISIKNLNKIVIALDVSLQSLIAQSCGNNTQDNKNKIFVILEKLKKLNPPKLKIIGNMVENIDTYIQSENIDKEEKTNINKINKNNKNTNK